VSLFLGIDTATLAVSVALVRDGIVLSSFECPGARRQTEVLHPALASCLDDARVAPSELDAVVVDLGPGRFTGVRVGLAAAKGLAFGAQVRAIGFTSTEILLEGARGLPGGAAAVVDLRRGEVAVCFSDGHDSPWRTTPLELGRLLAKEGRTGTVLVGDGAIEYRALISEGAGWDVLVAGTAHASPSARDACALAERAGEIAGGPCEVKPLYLRGAEVRLGWATRDGAATPTRMEVS
jgi:tRNA threonylcarbamoyladenosine biosynthesis protein TsaB